MSQTAFPYPPLELANRVGSLDGAAKPMECYDTLGRAAYGAIVSQLPEDWSFAGKRILDFGCGAGRTLRHFTKEAEVAEVCGCDIDEPSIRWIGEHMCPPFHVLMNGPEPPLDQPSSSFDLIWCVSVFTHITDSWSRWLVELHRLLKTDGLLYLTFMGSGTSLQPEGFGGGSSFSHGSVLMRNRDRSVDVEMLERIAPGDTREAAALAHNLAQSHAETARLRHDLSYVSDKLEQMTALEAHAANLERRLAMLESSRSWRVTGPLRSIGRWVRR